MALALALAPATAFADGAGDDQYQDPLTAPSTTKKAKKTPTRTAPASTTPAAATAPAAASAPVASPGSASNPAASNELPRTGMPAGLVGLAGATMIAAGASLRRRTASE